MGVSGASQVKHRLGGVAVAVRDCLALEGEVEDEEAIFFCSSFFYDQLWIRNFEFD